MYFNAIRLTDLPQNKNIPGTFVNKAPGILILFELDGSNRFFADVPQDTVDAVDGRDNPVAHAAQNAEGNLGNGGGYGVRRIDGADDDGPAHVTLALSLHITDTGGLEVRDDAEVLPGHFRQAADFLADDGIGLTERFQAIPRDGADAADAETRAGERLTVNHAVRQAEGGRALPVRTEDRPADRRRCGAP